MVQHELKYQQWLKQYRLGPFYKKDPYIIRILSAPEI